MDLSNPRVMGIINVTPDSFYYGSRHVELTEILKCAEKMLKDGADFLDVGGYSSRPGAEDIPVEEELRRVSDPIVAMAREFPEALITVDTFRSQVAGAALGSGACLVNDISGGDLDPHMMDLVGKHGVPYIAMHMRGTPQTMKQLSQYDDLLGEVVLSFAQKLEKAREAGIKDIIFDPGFGFAKTIDQNFYLLNHVDYLRSLDRPVMVGISRKSFIYKSLNSTPEQAVNGTTVLNTVALLKGASILRVHDVKEAVEAVKLVNQLMT